MNPILHMRRLRLREVRPLTQSHTASKGWSQGKTQAVCSDPQSASSAPTSHTVLPVQRGLWA